jgi:hypothetical protein
MLQSRGLREPANRCGIATELIHGDPIGCITQVTEQGKKELLGRLCVAPLL